MIIFSFSEHSDTHRYAILCGGDKLFLDIDKQNQIIAKKLSDGGLNYFNLRCTEIAGEFVIMDYKDFEREQKND